MDRLLPSLWQWVCFADIPLNTLDRSQWVLRKLFCSYLVRICCVTFAYLPSKTCIPLVGAFEIDELLKKESSLCHHHHKDFSAWWIFCHLMKCSVSQQQYGSAGVGPEVLWERDVINTFSVASTLLKTRLQCWQSMVPSPIH